MDTSPVLNEKNSMTKTRQPLIVLIHGLWMTGMEMSLLAHRLRRYGFYTVHFSYASRKAGVKTHAERLLNFIQFYGSHVHVVCHSLGGIVLCHMVHAHTHSLSSQCRVMFLGSPLAGSTVVRERATWWPLHHATAMSRDALMQGCPAGCCKLEAGMIAGSINIGLGMFFLKGHLPADGLVAHKDTCVPWIKEHVTIKANHIGLLFSSEAARFTAQFLKKGTFSPKCSPGTNE